MSARSETGPPLATLLDADWHGPGGLDAARSLVDGFLAYWDARRAVLRTRNLAAQEGLPVVVVSSLTQSGSQAALEAMEAAMEGRTTFIVAHRLSTLRRADLILVLDRGRLIQSGTHAELMAQDGQYRRAILVQSEGATA